MNELQIFQSPEFGRVRTVSIDGEPWFVGKDIALALGYCNTKDALSRLVDAEDKGGSRITTPSGEQDMTVINESGLYNLVLSSKLPSAKKFKRWITHEVIPAIRKTGGYQVPQSPAEQMAQGILADAVTASKTSILVGGLAKLIKSGTEKNMPTQRAMDMKLFEVKEGSFVDGNGVNRITRTTKVTGKGQVYFVNKFLNGSKVVLE